MYIFEDSNEKNSGEKCFQTDSRKIHHTAEILITFKKFDTGE